MFNVFQTLLYVLLDAKVLIVDGHELELRGDHLAREPPPVKRQPRRARSFGGAESEVHEPAGFFVHVDVTHRAVLRALVLDVLADVDPPLGLRLLRGVEHVLQQQALRRDG